MPHDPLRVITSGALAQAVELLVPRFTEATGIAVDLSFGSSLGAAPDSIPSRLAAGEEFDLLFLAEAGQRDYAAKGLIDEAWVPLVDSQIGAAVRDGAPLPDISTVDAFRAALLSARSIAHAASASGIYLSTEVFPRLDIAEEMKVTARAIYSERVGRVVARGEAELGFQQMSELLPIPGIRIVGRLPAGLAKGFVFGAGFGRSSARREAAEELLRYLGRSEAREVIRSTGLDPIL